MILLSAQGAIMARKKKVSPGNRLVAYYRYSGGSQQTEQSIEGQRRDCEAYARQHGLTIVHEYIDRHISGRGVESRLAFQQMIADSSKHLFDLVICWKTDRFARNRYDSAVYKKKLRDNGVRILYAAESSVEGPEGIILEGLMESLAEYYSAELAQKMRRGMRESALKGRAINPSRPLGLTTDEHKRFIIDEKNAPTIRFIFEHYAAGESSASIVEQLNAAGLRTSKGNAFNKCSIPRIIQNEAYHGVYICKAYDVRIDGAIPAIIYDDLWKRAQKMLTLNKQHRAPHSSHADYLLSGKLFCGCCHSLMRGISGHNCRNDVYYYYACYNRIPLISLEHFLILTQSDVILFL
jgi:DNA invertase Pin-like site-specific DNA recombinase